MHICNILIIKLSIEKTIQNITKTPINIITNSFTTMKNINESVLGPVISILLSGKDPYEESLPIISSKIGDVHLENPELDVDQIINEMAEHMDDIEIIRESILKPSKEEKERYGRFKDPYIYAIYQGVHGTSLYACFTEYEDINEISKHDYINICRLIALKLSKFGSRIDITNSNWYWADHGHRVKPDYAIVLVNESEMSDIRFKYGDDSPEIEEPVKTFKNIASEDNRAKDMEYEDILVYSYDNNEIGLAIPLNDVTIADAEQYLNFADDYIHGKV